MGRRNRDPEALSVRETVERYLRRRQADAADSSVKTWRYRLKLFVEWCEELGIEAASELQSFDLDEYHELRSSEVSPATLEGEMWTLRKYVEYLEQLGAVDDLADAVRVPDIDDEDRANDVSLPATDALPLLRYFRGTDEVRGTRQHVLLELAWFTGARQGGIRALDLRDVHRDECFLEFVHRPGTDTPLKNKSNGERPVAVPAATMEVVRLYQRHHRKRNRDDHGRQPLLTTRDGRPGTNTMRNWSYLATQPCRHAPCPHGKSRATCEWVPYAHASKCPSTRSLHRIRTGTITWQLDVGLPPEVVAERVNSSVSTIEQHYDVQSPRERMERRRRPYVDQLTIDDVPDE